MIAELVREVTWQTVPLQAVLPKDTSISADEVSGGKSCAMMVTDRPSDEVVFPVVVAFCGVTETMVGGRK